ncbi:uncharacterized protein BKA78DRAFT_346338 [Phyllosticta capitalensis]|uniref:uncharacterized protein n=1 Tax=Phyllosticta capitalensis TaxID=121624 RepID=UPI0031309E2F
MLDLDIFAVLVPSSLSAHKAFALPENGCLSVPNPVQHTAAEILKPLESEARDLSKELLRPGNLLLRFSDLFKDRLKNPGLGWVFGSDPSQCDVVLDDSERTWLGQGVSQRHFHVTIDQTHRILLHDGSQYGMSVGHQGDNEHLRRQGFTWILALEPGPQHWEKVTINVPSVRGIQFEIEFPHHRAQSNPKIKTEYTKRLHQFVKEYNERKKELPIQTLGLGNDLITGKPSQVETVVWIQRKGPTRSNVSKWAVNGEFLNVQGRPTSTGPLSENRHHLRSRWFHSPSAVKTFPPSNQLDSRQLQRAVVEAPPPESHRNAKRQRFESPMCRLHHLLKRPPEDQQLPRFRINQFHAQNESPGGGV